MSFHENARRTTSICLTKYCIDKIIWSQSEKKLLVGAMEVGHLFYINV